MDSLNDYDMRWRQPTVICKCFMKLTMYTVWPMKELVLSFYSHLIPEVNKMLENLWKTLSANTALAISIYKCHPVNWNEIFFSCKWWLQFTYVSRTQISMRCNAVHNVVSQRFWIFYRFSDSLFYAIATSKNTCL